MQNALIRKKLEEQRENFRKRQEQGQKGHIQKQECERKHQQEPAQDNSTSPSQSPDEIPKCGLIDSPKKISGIPQSAQQQIHRQHIPSPNIFTPTSVLRKMTAEKESDGVHKIGFDKKKPIIGVQQSQPIRSQQQQFMGNMSQVDRMMQIQPQNGSFGKGNWDSQLPIKPQGTQGNVFVYNSYIYVLMNFQRIFYFLGRPIVKGAVQSPQQQPPNPMMVSAQQVNTISGNFDFQQQQQIQKMNIQKQFIAQQQQQQQLLQMKKQQQMDNPVLTQFMAQQQQRAHMIRSQQFPHPMNYQQQMMHGLSQDQDESE